MLSVDKTVIYRELKRNSDERNGVYKAKLAQSKYEKRLFSKPKYMKTTPELKQQIVTLLEQDYSPEQVNGFMKKNNQQTLSHESIYQMIWKDKRAKGTLYEHLRRKGRRYRKRGSSKDVELG